MSVYSGVNFNNVRKALWLIFFGTNTEELVAYKYILPMQQNFFNPIEGSEDSEDTFIQYFIDNDKKLTQDQFGGNYNYTHKLARVTLRFVGARAEEWAKSTHHFTKRKSISRILSGVCNAELLEAIGDIQPTNVDFFGKNAVIAFDVEIKLRYHEAMELNWEPLTGVSLGQGKIETNRGRQE